MEDNQGMMASESSSSSKRMSLPPTFEQQTTQRASLPPRPNAAARHSKRLTLNFPISIPPPAPPGTPSEHSPSPMMTPAHTDQSSGYPSPSLASAATAPAPGDAGDESSNFLVALAAQERKVLELREELQRAEADLATLKRQWALNERGRKHTQIKHRAEAMKPLRNPEQDRELSEKGSADAKIEGADPVLQSQTRMSKELERKASVIKPVSRNGAVSSNGRRVFQSSRHARTLSLLSPDMGSNFQNSFPQPPDLTDGGEPGVERTSRHPRSATLPSLERGEEAAATARPRRAVQASDDDKARWRRSMPMPPPSHDALVRTSKQMATDFKDGLWTFLEDIRQATVGEEGISGTESRIMQSPSSFTARTPRTSNGSRTSSPRSRERPTGGLKSTGSSASRVNQRSKHGKNSTPTDTDVSFWNEFGVDTPGQTTATAKSAGATKQSTPSGAKEQNDSTSNDVVGDWDAWDTPVKSHTPSSSRSTFNSKRDHSPSSDMTSPRTSTSSRHLLEPESTINNADAIPWPSLTKLRPSSLTRTASNLMDEWERSLTASPELRASP